MEGVPVEEKVAHLEENLKRPWKLCRIWQKDACAAGSTGSDYSQIAKVELQNAELVNLLAKVVEPKS